MFPLTPWAGPRSSFVQPVEPPDVDPDTGGLISITFNPAWLPFVLGALTQLTQLSTWSGDDAAKTLAVDRATLLLNLVGYPMATVPGPEPTGPPPITRYDPDTDTVQTSFDGGVTWIDNPSGDPRNASTLPPQTGDNANCNSAASARKYLTRFASVLQTVGGAGVTATGLGYSLIGLLIELTGPWAIIADVAVAASLGFIAAGLSAINEAFSDENLDTLECIFYCHTQAGKVSGTAFGQILSDVSDQIGGTDATILTAALTLMGVGGLNSSMALKLDTDDCSGCGCDWCYTFDFAAGNGGWSSINSDGWSSGEGGWISESVSGDSLLSITISFASTTLKSVAVTYVASGDPGCRQIGYSASGVPPDRCENLPASGVALNYEATSTSLIVNVDTSGSTPTNKITSIVVTGSGVNPFGDSNC